MFKPTVVAVPLLTLLLAACGGSGDPVIPESSATDGDNNSSNSALTYYPLQFLQQGDGYVEESLFAGLAFVPEIEAYLIAPVNASDLQPAAAPDVSEFKITINDEDIDAKEQGLVMQPVRGLEVSLSTLILVDTSTSMQAVDKTKLIAEIKSFIQLAQASSDSVIKNQQFTIAAFNGEIDILQGTLTSDAATLNTVLDNLAASWPNTANGTALYKAIVAGVGTYVGTGSSGSDEDDFSADTLNDLVDGYRRTNNVIDLLRVSSVVLFSAGGNTPGKYTKDDAQAALNWQSLLVYSDANSAVTSDSTAPQGMAFSGKPMFYVAVGGTDSNVAGLSSSIISAANDNFDGVAEALVAAQQEKTAVRTKADNQYLVRFARLLPDSGTYTLVFASNTSTRNYSLTSEFEIVAPVDIPLPTVEITGPNNAYLAGNRVSIGESVVLSPATRWTNEIFDASSYSWTVGGTPRAADSGGSITLTPSDAGSDVVLTNNTLTTGTTSVTVTTVP